MITIATKIEEAHKMISIGKVLGIFLLETKGMAKHIVHVKPSVIRDLSALIALYIPGPMKYIKFCSYLKHRRGR